MEWKEAEKTRKERLTFYSHDVVWVKRGGEWLEAVPMDYDTSLLFGVYLIKSKKCKWFDGYKTKKPIEKRKFKEGSYYLVDTLTSCSPYVVTIKNSDIYHLNGSKMIPCQVIKIGKEIPEDLLKGFL